MKNLKNYLIVFLLGLMIPLTLGYIYQVPGLYFQASDFLSTNNPQEASFKAAKSKLQSLYDIDIQDYQRLKSLEKKYSKANDILAKMMTIFLADLGLRISKSDIVEMVSETQTDLNSKQSFKPSPSKNCPKPKKCPTLNELATEKGFKLVRSENSKDKKWITNEDQLDNLIESDTPRFLKSVEIEDFFDEIRSMKKARTETWNDFNGRFEGLLLFDNPDRPPADLVVDIEVTKTDDNISGNYKIELSRDGQAFSSSSGDGNPTILKQNNDSKGIFVDLGGKQGFLQLYFLNSKNTLIGNYYRQTDISAFKKEGTTKVFRQIIICLLKLRNSQSV